MSTVFKFSIPAADFSAPIVLFEDFCVISLQEFRYNVPESLFSLERHTSEPMANNEPQEVEKYLVLAVGSGMLIVPSKSVAASAALETRTIRYEDVAICE